MVLYCRPDGSNLTWTTAHNISLLHIVADFTHQDTSVVLTLLSISSNSSVAASERLCLVENEYTETWIPHTETWIYHKPCVSIYFYTHLIQAPEPVVPQEHQNGYEDLK